MRWLRYTAGVLLTIQVAACSKTVVLDNPGIYVEAQKPGKLYITRDGRNEEIVNPRVLSDTIFGWDMKGEPVTIPLSSVSQVRVRQTAMGPTIALGVAALIGIAIIGKTISSDAPAPQEPDPEDAVVPAH